MLKNYPVLLFHFLTFHSFLNPFWSRSCLYYSTETNNLSLSEITLYIMFSFNFPSSLLTCDLHEKNVSLNEDWALLFIRVSPPQGWHVGSQKVLVVWLHEEKEIMFLSMKVMCSLSDSPLLDGHYVNHKLTAAHMSLWAVTGGKDCGEKSSLWKRRLRLHPSSWRTA